MTTEKFEKLIANLHNKKFKFNRKAWLYLIQKRKFKLMNNSVFIKTMKNVRKHRDIQFVAFKAGNNHLVSKANYHATKFFSENLLAIEMRKAQK